MKKELRLNIILKTSDMFDFLARHTYSNFSGIFGVVLSVGALIFLAFNFRDNDAFKNVILLITGSLFTVVNPLLLYSKAKQQIKLNPMFKEPLVYVINDDGILVSQNEEQLQMEWKDVANVVETKRSIIIYINTVRAYIFPKEFYKDEYEAFASIIENNVDKKKYKLKNRRVK